MHIHNVLSQDNTKKKGRSEFNYWLDYYPLQTKGVYYVLYVVLSTSNDKGE